MTRLFNVVVDACGIVPPAWAFPAYEDRGGCRREKGHYGSHQSHLDTDIIDWDVDEDCDCENCKSADPDDWCIAWSLVFPRVERASKPRRRLRETFR